MEESAKVGHDNTTYTTNVLYDDQVICDDMLLTIPRLFLQNGLSSIRLCKLTAPPPEYVYLREVYKIPNISVRTLYITMVT